MSTRIACLFLVIGFVLGWASAIFFAGGESANELPSELVRDVRNSDDYGSTSLSTDKSPDIRKPMASGSSDPGDGRLSTDNSPGSPAEDGQADARFTELLAREKFPQAMEFMSRAGLQDDRELAHLRGLVLSHLKKLMTSNDNLAFTELTEAYLADYYNDTEVLLLLADFNRRNDYFFEAVSVFQLASEYVYSIDDRTTVAKSFADFIASVDRHFSAQSNWYRLSQVYYQAEVAGLLSPAQQAQQAAVYVKSGEPSEGKRILIALQQAGQLTPQGRALLDGLSTNNGEQVAAALPFSYDTGVPLKAAGNQFLIEVGVERSQSTLLLIDTGASMTTLSNSAFERIRGSVDYQSAGARMFSTANGFTRGQVYRLAQFTMGPYVLRDIDIAVLNFDMNNGVDGLLGMNVLGQFKFQLDQEKPELLLTPR